MTHDEAIRRASRAEQIINDEMVREALDGIEAAMMDAWAASAEGDSDGRERLYRMFRMSRSFRAFFESVMSSGVVAEHQLQLIKRGQFDS